MDPWPGHPARCATSVRVSRSKPTSVNSHARLGGDEFPVVLPGADLAAAHRAGQRLRESAQPAVGCSIGVAQWRRGLADEELIAEADASLYRSKEDKAARRALTTGSRPA